MEIVRAQRDGHLELFFEGRLDAYWAQHLAESVGQVMREGTHAVRLNLSKAVYISSAGIGTLVQFHKDFQAVHGSFGVVDPSPQVQKILEMVGLRKMLLDLAPSASQAATHSGLEIYDCGRGVPIRCEVMGYATRLAGAAFGASDCTTLPIEEDSMALGLGALGEGFAACRERFGEFLAVAGAAAYQPTDGANFPDYMVSSHSFVPQVTALYGVRCEGGFSKLVRFEEAAPLSRVVEQAMGAAGTGMAAVVIVAESAGLVGAALKRPPVNGGSLFAYPGIQGWLSFSPERCYAHHLVLLAGVAGTNPPERLRPFLRPLAKGSPLLAHFHAAAFGYRPLPKGRLELRDAVRRLFDAGGLQGVLHVLGDDRERGAGESELMRGACWVGPIGEGTA